MATSDEARYTPAVVPLEASPELRRFLDEELARIADKLQSLDDRVRQIRIYAQLNGVVLLYQWDDTTDTTIRPADGYMKGNSIQLPNVTQFAVATIDAYGRPILGNDLLEIGDLITVAAADLTASAVFSVTALPTPQGTPSAPEWFQLNVVSVGGSGAYNPKQDEYVRASWRPDNIVP